MKKSIVCHRSIMNDKQIFNYSILYYYYYFIGNLVIL